MKILFEYPYILLTLLGLCILVLGGVGAYFAMQGVKTAKGTAGADFLSVARLKKSYETLVKTRESRCLICIRVSIEDARSVYSAAEAQRIYTELETILLRSFYADAGYGIARYDAQSFAVLNRWDAELAKKGIVDCLTEVNRCLLKNKAINMVDIEFGFYCANTTEVPFETAVDRAMKACMLAEDEHKPYVEWSSSGGKALEKKIKIENTIENEIDNNRFFLEYQPVLDAKTKKIVGAEVLARLNSEQDGVLSPGSFLSAVSAVGVSDKFDYYIFEKTCKWISNNRAQREKYVYTVNFSRTTLCAPDFAQRVMQITDKYQLSCTSLAVEVLEDENVVGATRAQMIDNLLRLREKGFLVLLDDFGSGYTTFSDLQNLAITTVKVDKSITQKTDTDTGRKILENVVRTAHDLGFKTVCEGIETAQQEAAAVAAGSDMLQGFYYYRPMAVTQLEKLFEQA